MSLNINSTTHYGDTRSIRIKLNFDDTLYNHNITATRCSIEDQIISSTEFSLNVSFLFMGYDDHSVKYYGLLVFLKFSSKIEETILVNSEAMFINNRTFKNDSTWTLVFFKIKSLSEFRKGPSEIDIKIEVIKPTLNKFNDLYNDVDMTDFELRVGDDCVRFHRVVLALSSPVLKTMLSGKWKETTEGHLEVPGITKDTIQQFKEYIYTDVVPENVSLELFSLASYYMMTELEEICAEKIVDTLTSENIWSVLDYCVSHKLTKLLTAILNRQANDNVISKALNSEVNE